MAKRRRSGGRVPVKSHSRSPRGSNRGKKRPSVKSHSRRRPDPSSYPRYPKRKRRSGR